MKSRKVLMFDRNDKLIKAFDCVVSACNETGIAYSTIYTQCKTNSKGWSKYYFRFDDNPFFVDNKVRKTGIYNREVVYINKNGEYVGTFGNQAEASKKLNISLSAVNKSINGKRKFKDGSFMYRDEYEDLYGIIEDKECNPEINNIEKPKSKEYYVNVLVGLANDTLIDGAVYNINGSLLTYNKNDKALQLDKENIYTQSLMFTECEIELPLLLPKEKEFLSNLLKAFNNVKGIIKCKDRVDGFEFIRIETSNLEDTLVLPSFVEGKYYNGLKLDTLYQLKDLGL